VEKEDGDGCENGMNERENIIKTYHSGI